MLEASISDPQSPRSAGPHGEAAGSAPPPAERGEGEDRGLLHVIVLRAGFWKNPCMAVDFDLLVRDDLFQGKAYVTPTVVHLQPPDT